MSLLKSSKILSFLTLTVILTACLPTAATPPTSPTPIPTTHPSSIPESKIIGCWVPGSYRTLYSSICFEFNDGAKLGELKRYYVYDEYTVDARQIYSHKLLGYSGKFEITNGESGTPYNVLIFSPTSGSDEPTICSRISLPIEATSFENIEQIFIEDFVYENKDFERMDSRCSNLPESTGNPNFWVKVKEP